MSDLDLIFQNEGEFLEFAHRVGIDDTDEFLHSCYTDPESALTLLRSLKMSNRTKLHLFFTSILKPSNVTLITGRKRSGKSVILRNVIDYSKKVNPERPIQLYRDFYQIPGVENIFSLDHMKQGALLIIDELGVKFPARNFSSSSASLLTKFLVLAGHKQISVVGTVQNTTLGDINFYRLSDNFIFKSMSPKQLETERDSLSSLDVYFISYLDSSKKSLTYFSSSDYSFLVDVPLPEDYYAFQYENINLSERKEDVLKYIQGARDDGLTDLEIFQELLIYGLRLPFSKKDGLLLDEVTK